MAITLKVESSRRATYLIAPKDLKPNPEYNGRFVRATQKDNEDLLASIVAYGQDTPIKFKSDGGWPVIVDGNRRWEMVQEGMKRGVLPSTFRLECVPFDGNEQEAFLAAVRANRFRTGKNPVDDAHNIVKMGRFGMDDEQIAKEFGEDVAWVKKTRELVGLSKEGREALVAGSLKAPAARRLAKLSAAIQREKLASGKPLTAASLRDPNAPKRVSVKTLRATIQTAADDTTENKAVRAFCGRLLATIDGKQYDAESAA
jgi:ParB-like chromosome segregation protein Spo0J